MKYLAVAGILMLLWAVSRAQATNWTSPDGKLGFNLPSDGSLVEVKNPPQPATAMWNSADGAARLLFIAQPNPQNMPLEQAGLEEGTIKQFPGGKILSSQRATLGGVPAFTIAATGSQKIYLQQTVLTFGGTFYKVMAAGPTPISSDPRFANVFNSVTVLDPNPVVPGSHLSDHDLSVKAGEIGFAVLLIAAVVMFVRRSTRCQDKSQPHP